jgi:hypothetical protein
MSYSSHFQNDYQKNMLSNELIIEFKRLYKTHYGVELSNEEVVAKSSELIAITRILIQK